MCGIRKHPHIIFYKNKTTYFNRYNMAQHKMTKYIAFVKLLLVLCVSHSISEHETINS